MGGVAITVFVAYVGESWLFAAFLAAGLSVTLWQFFVPVDYELSELGLRRTAFRRSRLMPWHTIRAYQPRSTGVVLYQRHDPARIDVLRSEFVPYPPNSAEATSALRQHLSHAVELPQ
jgi:hypothetical protein